MFNYKKYNGENFKGNKNKNYFEGWYYKIVSKDRSNVYAFIPGISYPLNKKNAHSFIQIINGKTGETNYIKYPVEYFNPINNSLSIKINNDNIFSKHGINLRIDDKNINVRGKIYFNNHTEIEKTFLSPGAMGFFSYFSFMECFHEVISMNHYLKGRLQINNEILNFDGGKGYIEKDWGTSFPENWVWIQSNHFSDPTVSIMCSIAKIPFLFCSFTGFICILTIKGMEYRFATYNNSKIDKLILLDKEICISLKNSKYSLQITALRNFGGSLQAPVFGNMSRKIHESINSKVKIKLKNSKGTTIFTDLGEITGLEITKGALS